MQILVTIDSGVSEGAGVEFPTFPLTCVVVLKTVPACDDTGLKSQHTTWPMPTPRPLSERHTCIYAIGVFINVLLSNVQTNKRLDINGRTDVPMH